MIRYVEGNILDSSAQVIVNPVNTVGAMGKGLALSLKELYPSMFDAYVETCKCGRLGIGNLILYCAPDRWILLLPTKKHWRDPSKLEYIEAGLKSFVCEYANKDISSIAFPKLGCGNGGLSWDDVKPIMEKHLNQLPIDVYIYI